MVLFGGDGADSINMVDTTVAGQTILGGNDSADDADSIPPAAGTTSSSATAATTRSIA